MRILQINSCHRRRGGADAVYFNTGELLEGKGHEVAYFSQEEKNTNKSNGSEFHILAKDFLSGSFISKIQSVPRFLYSKEAQINLEKLVKKYKPEIAHIHTYKGVLTPSIFDVLKNNNIPILCTLHDYGLLCPHNLFLDGRGSTCTKCLDTNNSFHCVLNKCNRGEISKSIVSYLEYEFHKQYFPFHECFDHLISVSKFNLELHIKKPELSKKISHLYNFFPRLDSVKKSNNKSDYFVYTGRLSHEKGLHTLIKAWFEYAGDSELRIYGDGPILNDLINYRDKLGASNINFFGYTEKEKLFEAISNACFAIVPSEWYENNPLSIIEAYAYGTPVIAANIGGITEIVEHSKTGFLFKPKCDESLGKCIKNAKNINSDRYREMSSMARDFAEKNFHENTHYEKLMSIYSKIIKNSN